MKAGRLASLWGWQHRVIAAALSSLLSAATSASAHRKGILTMPRLVAATLSILFLATICSAKEIYIAQNAAGADIGTDCANAHSAGWFNTAANWGAGANQISPGDTAHLCGTFTGTAGSTGLTPRASGTAATPTVILFEPNAVMTAPYWGTNDGNAPTGGAIKISGVNYITVDGGTNGTIQNTLNGTPGGACIGGPCSFKAISAGIVISGCNTCEIRNLTILKIYVHTGGSSDFMDATYGVYGSNTVNANILIHHNTISDAGKTINLVYPSNQTSSNFRIYNNTLSRACWAIGIGDGNTNAILNGLKIHDNDISDGYAWWDTGDYCHLNGMHIFAAASGSTINNAEVYNNYHHGDWGGATYGRGHQTSAIRLAGLPGTMPGALVYNNVVTQPIAGDCPANGYIVFAPSGSGGAVYNNTIVGGAGPCGYGIQIGFNTTNVTVKNNIVANVGRWIHVDTGSLAASDNNLFYNSAWGFFYLGTAYTTLATWQAAGWDANSVVGNPNLNSTYHPLAGSTAIGLGANLTSLGIAALDFDKADVTRPGSGPWDAGAYQHSSTVPTTPMNVTVQ